MDIEEIRTGVRMDDERALSTITEVRLKGFKSFIDEQRIDIRPLTLLAGTNSSGKSSALQPLLLMKQTLEEPYDPGPLRLSGDHVRFTAASQVLSRLADGSTAGEFEIFLGVSPGGGLRETFRRSIDDALDLVRMEQTLPRNESLILEPGLSSLEIEARFPILKSVDRAHIAEWQVSRNKCFLGVVPLGLDYIGTGFVNPIGSFADALRSIIHVPGHRGNPERTYATTRTDDYFLGEFTGYAASIIALWQRDNDIRLNRLSDQLCSLGLTWRVEANPLNANEVEILVGRLRRERDPRDLVNIADVGFGVSQMLPVLVALLVAKPGQLVYIEEPELHLHPRAQQELASVLAEAAKRGVRVVVETHSSLLLLALQTLVAEDKVSPEIVRLHWFKLDTRGATKVTKGSLDRLGAYGEWPEDFGDVEAAIENRYLNAVEEKMFARANNGKK